MAEAKPPKKPTDKIEIEPGADKRLANILKKALNTPPQRKDADQGERARKTSG